MDLDAITRGTNRKTIKDIKAWLLTEGIYMSMAFQYMTLDSNVNTTKNSLIPKITTANIPYLAIEI